MDKQRIVVLDAKMAYAEAGTGDPIVLLHGNPTSSYLWRNVIPHLEGIGRCIAPDLIGMGDSDRLSPSGPERYGFAEHRRYLDALLQALGVAERVTLVAHDWGGALAFDWARRHPDAVRGIAYMETIVAPMIWQDVPEAGRPIFEAFRTAAGEKLILEKNLFVERILPASIVRKLSAEEMDEYRRPWVEAGENRRAMLTWPRELPIDGKPGDTAEIVTANAAFMASSQIPKLFVDADPGTLSEGMRRTCRGWPNQVAVTVPGLHFIQEDSPGEIGSAIAGWVKGLA